MLPSPPENVVSLPRPGRALALLLALMTSVAISGALVVHWTEGHGELASWLAFRPSDREHLFDRPWTLLTSGILTSPHGLGHLLASLVGLYFFGSEIEKRWGGGRVMRFVVSSIVFGNLAVLAGTLVPIERGFHPELAMGPLAAVAALASVWAKENWDRSVRLFFAVPMTGRAFFWLALSVALLMAVFREGIPEGGLSPIAGMSLGLLFGRSPVQQRRASAVASDADETGPLAAVRAEIPAQKRKAPPLRVVQRSGEEDPKNKKPTKDKRYLN